MNHELEREIIYYLKELSELPENIKAKTIYDKYISEHTEIDKVFIENGDIIGWYLRMVSGDYINAWSPKMYNIKELRTKYRTSLIKSKYIMDEIETGK